MGHCDAWASTWQKSARLPSLLRRSAAAPACACACASGPAPGPLRTLARLFLFQNRLDSYPTYKGADPHLLDPCKELMER